MTEITVDGGGAYPFTPFPETVRDEVAQNVMTILLVLRGSQPLFRELGVSSRLVDRPMHLLETEMAVELFDQVEKFEPRAAVKEIHFRYEPLLGTAIPTVTFSVKEEDA